MNIKPVVQSSTLFLVSHILVLFYKVNISSICRKEMLLSSFLYLFKEDTSIKYHWSVSKIRFFSELSMGTL